MRRLEDNVVGSITHVVSLKDVTKGDLLNDFGMLCRLALRAFLHADALWREDWFPQTVNLYLVRDICFSRHLVL